MNNNLQVLELRVKAELESLRIVHHVRNWVQINSDQSTLMMTL